MTDYKKLVDLSLYKVTCQGDFCDEELWFQIWDCRHGNDSAQTFVASMPNQRNLILVKGNLPLCFKCKSEMYLCDCCPAAICRDCKK